MTDSPRPLRMALIPVAISAFTVLTCIGVCVGYPCFSTGFKYGIWLDTCPATDLRLQAIVEASGLVRGADGYVNVHPTAMWLQGKGASAYGQSQTFSRGARVALELRDLEDQPVSGMEVAGFKVSGSYLQSKVKLPDVPDGDYKLHAVVTTGFEIREIDVDLPLYAPAIVHIMSDRPLYKPGQEVLLRSAILKRTDLTPLDGRPGTWGFSLRLDWRCWSSETRPAALASPTAPSLSTSARRSAPGRPCMPVGTPRIRSSSR